MTFHLEFSNIPLLVWNRRSRWFPGTQKSLSWGWRWLQDSRGTRLQDDPPPGHDSLHIQSRTVCALCLYRKTPLCRYFYDLNKRIAMISPPPKSAKLRTWTNWDCHWEGRRCLHEHLRHCKVYWNELLGISDTRRYTSQSSLRDLDQGSPPLASHNSELFLCPFSATWDWEGPSHELNRSKTPRCSLCFRRQKLGRYWPAASPIWHTCPFRSHSPACELQPSPVPGGSDYGHDGDRDRGDDNDDDGGGGGDCDATSDPSASRRLLHSETIKTTPQNDIWSKSDAFSDLLTVSIVNRKLCQIQWNAWINSR